METIDTRGNMCPVPLIMTKKALKDLAVGEAFTVICDNETSQKNVSKYLRDQQAQVQIINKDGDFRIASVMPEKFDQSIDAAAFCQPEDSNRSNVICITSDQMGSGDSALGQILMKAFINTIKEIQPQPKAIVFYNSGILLTTTGADTISGLQELEKNGVEILVCGTCLNFYEKTKDLVVGQVSNMYDILQTLSDAHHVINP